MSVIPNTTSDHGTNRTSTTLAYDSANTQVVMFGGKNINRSSLSDTWKYPNAGSWSVLSPAASPIARYDHAMAYTSTDGYIVLFGGRSDDEVEMFADTWYWNNTTWQQLTLIPTITSPLARYGHSLTTDTGTHSRILFGGIGPDQTASYGHFTTLSESWSFSASTKVWTQFTSTITPPARAFHSDGYNGTNVIIWGGQGTNRSLLQDMYSLNISTMQWSSVSQGTTIPYARSGGAMAYDTVNSQMILFGGLGATNISNQTWAFKSGAWSLLTTTTHPTARYNAKMVFDSGTNKIVMYGGIGLDGGCLGDLWIFDCASQTWSGTGDYQVGQSVGPVY